MELYRCEHGIYRLYCHDCLGLSWSPEPTRPTPDEDFYIRFGEKIPEWPVRYSAYVSFDETYSIRKFAWYLDHGLTEVHREPDGYRFRRPEVPR